jgi:valyl-tRNA synthetase
MPAAYDHTTVEREVRDLWDAHRVHEYDPTATGPVFSVDTPPPYVSATHLHVGHAMSYSQPDFVVRYRRMRGDRVFYPMGFDDNGLPTERYVERALGVRAADLPRAEFVRLCLAETAATAARYEDLWRRIGLSVDWSRRYSTIDERCRRTAQGAFVTLHRRGHVRRGTDPILWCPECRTSLAQADVDDLHRSGRLHDVRFAGADGEPLTVATTRPELLPACVALYLHPGDNRHRHLLGTTARVPLFGHEVPVLADGGVDPAYGTGLMMVCTFGDGEDVTRWRRDRLDLRLVVGPDGRLTGAAGALAGLPVDAARAAAVRLLAADGLLAGSRTVPQAVGVHERCGTPLEFQIRPQWFVAIRDRRAELLARARELTWTPEFMRVRLEDWINGLKWDWNISRQRRYGVPFPVWFCRDCAEPVLADLADLPVDPLADRPPVDRCPACGCDALDPDEDVMDTWLTSSLTPQVNDGWAERGFPVDAAGATDLTPMSLRVQGFEIIRTWLFYSLVQSHLLFDRLPWTAAMVAGWGLGEQGRKISKRDLDASTTPDGFNRYVPDAVIERYGADALRLWAARAKPGTDLRYHEKDVRAGRKLAVKLWNLGRFVELHAPLPEPAPGPSTVVDRWLIAHLADTVRAATAALDRLDYAQAHQVVARFFWSVLCDRYVELVKDRFAVAGPDTAAARRTLRTALRAVLGLLAPYAPFVTEDVYQRLFRAGEGTVSLHRTPWPTVRPEWTDPAAVADRAAGDALAAVLDATRAARAALGLPARDPIAELVVTGGTAAVREHLPAVAEALRVAARAKAVRYAPAAPTADADLRVEVVP